MLYSIVLGLHIVVCLLLVIAVLLQSGKAADLAGAFGGMGSQSTFGPRGAATFLSKMTTTLAILFMVTSLSLWILAANRSDKDTVVQEGQQEQTTETPAATDTEKTTEPGTTSGEQQQNSGETAESTSESGTTSETGTETGTTQEDSTGAQTGQEKPPDSTTESKQ